MKNKQGSTKTYISEANQNRISDTLSVEGTNEQRTETEINDEPSSSNVESGKLATNAATTVEEESNEPEALSAETVHLPPTAASADAEAVAGLPVGGIYGQEGDLKAAKHSGDLM